jgi:hypothetical protein
MNGIEVFEKGYIARLTIPTDPIGATRRQVLEHSARTAVTAVASMLAARVLKLPQTYWAPITTMVIHAVISWCNTRSVVATFCWNGSWSGGWRLGRKSFQDLYPYSLPAFSCWDYFSLDYERIEARIDSGALRWQSCCSIHE